MTQAALDDFDQFICRLIQARYKILHGTAKLFQTAIEWRIYEYL